jgi:hypothetical protein
LDWTDGALIALHFAVSNGSSPTDKRDRAVWILDPEWLNDRVIDNDSVLLPHWPEVAAYLSTPFESPMTTPEFPVAIDPPHIAPRVAVQRSRFTIHGTRADGLEATSNKSGSESRLFKIIIPKRHVPEIKRKLTLCGVTRTTLFPDLDALGKELCDDLAQSRSESDKQ